MTIKPHSKANLCYSQTNGNIQSLHVTCGMTPTGYQSCTELVAMHGGHTMQILEMEIECANRGKGEVVLFCNFGGK